MVFFKQNKKIKDAAYLLFTKIVAQARKSIFYSDWCVADTLDGRFDLIILHIALVVRRLEDFGENKQTALLIRYLQEVLFDNMDMSLRELGVGDMSVGKKVKIMAEAYFGRATAYADALRSDDITANLGPVLLRNIYRENAPEKVILDHFVSYVIAQIKYLEKQEDEDFIMARITFDEVI